MRTDHILVAVKPGPLAAELVRAAASLAEPLSAKVTLLTVVDIPANVNPFGLTDGKRNDAILEKEAKRELKPFKTDLKADGIKVSRDTVAGEPIITILEAIKRHEPGFVIMGTHGRKGLARWFSGSVAEAVSRESDVPVMIVKASAMAEDEEDEDEDEQPAAVEG
ncbi:MAG: universal stress protein [Myxococcota bacterium]